MDNFLDKLAEKYNAQDMILANSQAESAQLKSLEDQVGAYEAVLQEMRKLNYKNSELTEKMYALFDGGVDSSMQDSVEEVLKKLFDLQQSSSNAEESLAGLSRQIAEIKEASLAGAGSETENVQNLEAFERLGRQLEEIKESSNYGDSFLTLSRQLEEIKTLQAEHTDREAPAAGAGAALPPELIEELSGLSSRIEELKAGSRDAEQFEQLSSRIEELKSAGQMTEQFEQLSRQIAELKDSGQNAYALEQVSRQIAELKEAQAAYASCGIQEEQEDSRGEELRGKLSELVEELKQQGQIDALTQETLSALAQSNAQTQDSLTEMKAAISLMREGSGEQRSAMDAALSELKDKLSGIEESSRAGGASATESEELRQSIAEILASGTETGNTVRSLKTSVDEQKNGLKAAIDNGIYGLKQENKELSELLQRVNTAVLRIDENSRSAPAAAASPLAEADKQAIEERFKAAEEFMHKESVKVYRNVQAVLNEKNDSQKESVENSNLSVELRVNKVKALVIFNMIFTLINLAVSILYIFGILQM